jgi:hypothetical protein
MGILKNLKLDNRRMFIIFMMALGILVSTVLLSNNQNAHASGPDVGNISIRLGQTYVLRGPELSDSPLNQYRDPNGMWHSFFQKSPGDSWTTTGWMQDAINGSLSLAIPKTDCGNWMFNTQKVGVNLISLVHHEDNCNYNISQTNKSMGIYASTDNGVTWSSWGKVISSPIGPMAGKVTGDGDCQFIDGHDGYLYAYCLRTWGYNDTTQQWEENWKTIVARAPTWGIGPGAWYKYNYGAWGSAGLGGGATALQGVDGEGKAAGYWVPQNKTMLIGGEKSGGGVRMYFSDNKTDFTKLTEPLIAYNASEEDWNHASASPLLSYFSVANNADGNGGSPIDGSNNVGNQFALWYRYSPSGSTASYYVKQIVYISYLASPPPFQVGNVLTRWVNPGNGQRRATVGPVEASGWSAEASLGFMMTAAPAGVPSLEVDECKYGADWYAVPHGGCGAGITRTRSLGWVYTTPQPNTHALYRCVRADSTHFLSTASDCHDAFNVYGTLEYLMGYIPNN